MRRIFFENKLFAFCESAPCTPSPNSCTMPVESIDDVRPAKLLEKVGNNNTLYITNVRPDEIFSLFCSQFPIVEAAGGVVENDEGEVLMIFRKGWWDLPKGHIDGDESPAEAAVMEVREETGLMEVEIAEPLCTTSHFHNAYGHWEIKRTAWFLMHCAGECPELTPEADEQITSAEWLRGRRLWSAVESSYGTVKDVFERFLEIKIK